MQLLEERLSSENIIPFYEAFLELYLFAGFPAAIEAVARLQQVRHRKQLALSPFEEPYRPEDFRRRGEQLCRAVYTTVYDKMRGRMQQLSPQLDEWMIIEGYGKTLSRPGLSAVERELIAVAILTALDWPAQQYAHLRGALNLGASVAQCAQLLDSIASHVPAAALERAWAFLRSRQQED